MQLSAVAVGCACAQYKHGECANGNQNAHDLWVRVDEFAIHCRLPLLCVKRSVYVDPNRNSRISVQLCQRGRLPAVAVGCACAQYKHGECADGNQDTHDLWVRVDEFVIHCRLPLFDDVILNECCSRALKL
jgi:hypothetical protein